MPKAEELLLKAGSLADALGVPKSNISLMKRAGYVFTHGYLTTVSSAREFLKAKGFRPGAARMLPPLHPSKSSARKRALAGISDEPSSSSGRPSSSRSALESRPAQTC